MPGPKKKPVAKLFLIEGNVKMDPLQPGRSSVQAEQRRLVWGIDIDDAIAKYIAYFASLSNPAEAYSVVYASGTEAIE